MADYNIFRDPFINYCSSLESHTSHLNDNPSFVAENLDNHSQN